MDSGKKMDNSDAVKESMASKPLSDDDSEKKKLHIRIIGPSREKHTMKCGDSNESSNQNKIVNNDRLMPNEPNIGSTALPVSNWKKKLTLNFDRPIEIRSDKKESNGEEGTHNLIYRITSNQKINEVADESLNARTKNPNMTEKPEIRWNLRSSSSLRVLKPSNDETPAAKQEKKGRERANKTKFQVSLSNEEIKNDICALTGSEPSTRLKKRTKIGQKQLDNLFPGLGLPPSITQSLYRVSSTHRY